MPYRVLTQSDLYRVGDDAAGKELGITESLEAGLNAMEGEGYALVQYVAPHVTSQNATTGATYSDARFIFHKGRPRTVLDDLREQYAPKG